MLLVKFTKKIIFFKEFLNFISDVILRSLNSVFGPNILFDKKGIIVKSSTWALIVKINFSEKYTPPLVVGRLTGVEDRDKETFCNLYEVSSK